MTTPPPISGPEVWRLRRTSAPEAADFIFPETGEAVLGRGGDADWRVEDQEVSRRHAKAGLTAGVPWVEDLESTRGLRINGELAEGRRVLTAGDLVEVGPVGFVVEHGAIKESAKKNQRFGSVPFRGERTRRVPLEGVIRFGRAAENDVVLEDPAISRLQFTVRACDGGFQIDDAGGRTVTRLNLRRFEKQILTLGDIVEAGPYRFRFDGAGLCVAAEEKSQRVVAADGLSVITKSGLRLLDRVSFEIGAGELVLLLGPSGAGKSTLIEALAGLRTIGEGTVQAGSTTPGYVPQDDIVHRELVVEEALGFAARLRLGPRPPIGEIRRAVGWAMDTLGIVTRRTLRIGKLSGGQRKRVSVASELVARPRVLLLDEPTSGLDPAAEMRLMQRLRQLADTGCTVLCSTHVPANFHLANRVLILDGGRLVYDGPPDEAAAAFGERDLIAVYGRLGGDVTQAGPKPEALPPTKSPTRRRRSPWNFFSQATLLFHRQAALFRGDSRQLLPLILAPVAVGLLAGWSGRTEYLALFVAWLSTLWFGCNNSAQEFVREAAIYRRERMAGLVRSAYLGVRFLWLTGITCSQAVLLVAALMVSTPAWHSAWGWVMMTIIASAAVGVACGLAISAWARQLPHALIAVPLLLIPLILLSGFVTPAHEMRPAVRSLAALTPSFSAQRMMDISCLWGKPATREVLEDYWVANLNLREVAKLKTGDTLRDWRVAAPSVAVLVLWIFGGLGVAWAGLIHRERPS